MKFLVKNIKKIGLKSISLTLVLSVVVSVAFSYSLYVPTVNATETSPPRAIRFEGGNPGSGGNSTLNSVAGSVGSAVGQAGARAILSGDGDAFEESLKQMAGSVLECSVDQILGQGLKGILSGLGQKLFGGILGNAGGNILGGVQSAVGGAVGGAAGGILGGIGGLLGGDGSTGGAIGGAIGQGAGELVGGLLGGFGAALGLGGQAVPVNTVSINDHIAAQTAKDIGSVEGGGIFQTPSLDSIAYCLANSVVQYTAQGSAQWFVNGNNGNPPFVENYPRYFRDIAIRETEDFLNELASSNLCEPYRDRVVRSISSQVSGNSHFYQQRCAIDQVDNYESWQQGQDYENSLQAFNARYSPDSNPQLVRVLAQAEHERRTSGVIQAEKIELDHNNGNLGERDQRTGDTVIKGELQYDQALKRMNLPEEKLIRIDEIGEAIDELFNNIFSIKPGGLIRKILEGAFKKDNSSSSRNSSSNNNTSTSSRSSR